MSYANYISDGLDTLSINTVDVEKEYRAESERERERLSGLGGSLRRLHVAWLYCRSAGSPLSGPSFDAWKAIVKLVGSTHDHWRELGFFLGIAQEDLNYIQHSAGVSDKTDLMLRVCVENEEATLAGVVEALLSLERYDVLKAIETPLLKISQFFSEGDTSYSDTGYDSNQSGELRIIKPQSYSNVLPPALRTTYAECTPLVAPPPQQPSSTDLDNYLREHEAPVGRSTRKPRQEFSHNGARPKKPEARILLTFSEDGIAFAEDIRRQIDSWSKEITVQTLTLNERRHEVFQNPHSVINNIIELVDYVVPVVTEQYLRSVDSCGDPAPSLSSAAQVDVTYARYVYTRLMQDYSNSCFNRKVRCVVPRGAPHELLAALRKYSLLTPWMCEVDFECEFKSLIKNIQKRVN